MKDLYDGSLALVPIARFHGKAMDRRDQFGCLGLLCWSRPVTGLPRAAARRVADEAGHPVEGLAGFDNAVELVAKRQLL